ATTLKELRAFAGEALPPYMLPAAILFLDQFPLTNNGKIDRKALPKPEDEIRSLSTTIYQAAQGETETILSRIWSKVLKLDRVGRDENYFELGGDSILSIQIVSQARRAGLKLSPRDLFEHQTIEELAAVAGSMDEAPAVNHEAIQGSAPLTPIQTWFFDHELPNPNHWNQAFLFNLSEPLEVARLKEAFAGLVKHHAALRTTYRQSSQDVLAESKVEFFHFAGDLTEAEIHDRCLEAQRSLDIEAGRLVSAVYFERGADRKPAKLFVAIHHLAVDGVSWRILLEDLEALYLGRAVESITTPFVNWAHHLAKGEGIARFESQRAYWEAAAKPFRLSSDQSITTAGDAESITVRLSKDETERLTLESVPAMRAQLDEVLVAIVAGAIAKATGNEELSMDLEGHGREESAGFDLSRTVGWFTTIYPLALNLPAEASVLRQVAETKKAMRAVPDRGFAFGLLGIDDPGRDVLFNFLGRFDQVTSESQLLSFADEDSGSWYDPQSSRSHLLEINSWIKDGCLEIKWTFASLARQMVESMALESVSALRGLQEMVTLKTDAWIAADFPLAQLREEDLAKLSGDIEDVLPLTPLQQLYYTLETARLGSGIDQWHWTLTGKVDPVALHEAWEMAVNAHSSLRTAFLGAGLAEPVQVVRPRCSIPFEIIQIEEESEFEVMINADRAKGLAVDAAPLMRLTLVEKPGSDARLIWTHHHLQIDGWSWPLLLSQVSEAYRAISGNLLMEPVQGKSIRDYLKWYRQVDLTASRSFWQGHLNGFVEPTPVSSRLRGNAVFHDLSACLEAGTVTKLNELARRLKCPLNAIVQSAWAILLSRQSGQSDVVFGATFSGRPAELPGVESIIGAFVNNLPVRVQLEESAAFESLAKSLQVQAVELGEHQHLPLGEIQQLSSVPLRSRLFDSLLVFQNYTIDGTAMQWTDDVSVTNFVAPVRTNYPLTLVVKPGSGSLDFDLIYQGGRFDRDSADLVLQALCSLLVRVAESPDLGIGECLSAVTLLTIPRQEIQAVSRGLEGQPPVTGLQKRIAKVWERAFGISDIGIDENFFDLGGHSLLLIQVHALLRRELKEELSVVDVFSHPTIRKLSAAIKGGEEKVAEPGGTRTHARPQSKTDDIAIVGMSGRFPGAESVDEFWNNLVHQVESIVDFSDEDLRSQGLNPEAMRSAGHYVQRRGQIPDPDQFDAAFFGMSPLEATATDPQQRLFLETAWSALEDAGYAPSSVKDRIGVFAGMSNNSFYEQYVQADEELKSQLGDLIVMMGNEKDYLATRTAYKLNLNGPALNIYTACSTSLVAVSEAVYALREGRCEMAIAGAVSLTFPQNRGYYYEEGGITSADG
ncbi:MAG: hypothetical protein KDN20_21440, partial [Verrucomicrobiae bacterium]|nr:hypothetical protein [Verrucomicrobiae bacterium]